MNHRRRNRLGCWCRHPARRGCRPSAQNTDSGHRATKNSLPMRKRCRWRSLRPFRRRAPAGRGCRPACRRRSNRARRSYRFQRCWSSRWKKQSNGNLVRRTYPARPFRSQRDRRGMSSCQDQRHGSSDRRCRRSRHKGTSPWCCYCRSRRCRLRRSQRPHIDCRARKLG